MSSTIEFIVDDSSPVITYFPPPSITPLPNNTVETVQQAQLAGWLTQFDNRNLLSTTQVGNGTSNHLTSHDGANFAFDFTGSAITLLGITKKTTYDITLDGNSSKGLIPVRNITDGQGRYIQILYQADNLSASQHTLSLTVHTQSTNIVESFFSFDFADIVTNVNPSSGQLSTTLFDDTILSFQGSWTFQQSQGPFILAGSPWGSSIVSFHQTGIQGDRISMTLPFPQSPAFPASNPEPAIIGFTVVGLIGSGSSNYTITVKSDVNGSKEFEKEFDGSFGWLAASELFVAEDVSALLGIPRGEDVGNVTVTVMNGAEAPLRIAGFNVSNSVGFGGSGGSTVSSGAQPTGSVSSSSGLGNRLPAGTIVALAFSSICLLGFILLGFFFYRRFRKRGPGMGRGTIRSSSRSVSRSSILSGLEGPGFWLSSLLGRGRIGGRKKEKGVKIKRSADPLGITDPLGVGIVPPIVGGRRAAGMSQKAHHANGSVESILNTTHRGAQGSIIVPSLIGSGSERERGIEKRSDKFRFSRSSIPRSARSFFEKESVGAGGGEDSASGSNNGANGGRRGGVGTGIGDSPYRSRAGSAVGSFRLLMAARAGNGGGDSPGRNGNPRAILPSRQRGGSRSGSEHARSFSDSTGVAVSHSPSEGGQDQEGQDRDTTQVLHIARRHAPTFTPLSARVAADSRSQVGGNGYTQGGGNGGGS